MVGIRISNGNSDSSQETDTTDGWIVALRNKILTWLPGLSELPTSRTATASEVTMMDSLSIQAGSHCSSSSSLGSLDMDPCCRLSDARMFTIQQQSTCRRKAVDFDQHLDTLCGDHVFHSRGSLRFYIALAQLLSLPGFIF